MLALPKAIPVIEPVDAVGYSNKFKAFIASHVESKKLPDSDRSVLSSDVDVYLSLRSQTIAVISSDDVSLDFDVALKYKHHMETIAPILSDYQTDIDVTYTWLDAFTQMSHKTTSIYLDYFYILYNMAQVESYRGAVADRGSDEGIKNAKNSFVHAVAILLHMKDSVLPYIRVTERNNHTICSEDILCFCIYLLLAQGQLCFYEKIVRDKRSGTMASIKPKIIAAVASQISVYYESAIDFLSRCTSVDASWSNYATYSSKCFLGTAEYWQSIADKEFAVANGSGYGIEVTRLRRAYQYLQDALSHAKRVALVATSNADVLMKAVVAALQCAEYDMTHVYFEAAPHDTTLDNIAPQIMAKAAAVREYTPSVLDKQLFQIIVPRSVQLIADCIRDEVTTMVQSACTEERNATNDARGRLSSVGLPATIDLFKADGKLPSSLWQKVQNIQELGGTASLLSKFNDLKAMSAKACSTIASIDNSISCEENRDDAFRKRHTTYTGVPSSILNIDIVRNTRDMRTAYSTAIANDSSIDEWFSHPLFRNSSKYLLCSKEQLASLLPKYTPPILIDYINDACAASVDISVLEAKLSEMAMVIQSRESSRVCLEKISSSNYVAMLSDRLSKVDRTSAGAMDEVGRVMKEELIAECKAHVDSIASLNGKQEKLLTDILNANEEFKKGRASDPTTVAREQMLADIEQIVNKYFTVLSQMYDATAFYNTLQCRLDSLMLNSEDLSYTQEMLRKEFESAIALQFERNNQENSDRDFAQRMYGMSLQQPSSVSGTSAYPTLHGAVDSPTVHRPSPVAAQYPAFNAAPTVLTAPAYAYNNSQQQQQQQAPFRPNTTSGTTATDIHNNAKAMRLQEMGFPTSKCIEALSFCNDDEVAALDRLLSTSAAVETRPPEPEPAPAPAPSFFSNGIWSRKK